MLKKQRTQLRKGIDASMIEAIVSLVSVDIVKQEEAREMLFETVDTNAKGKGHASK